MDQTENETKKKNISLIDDFIFNLCADGIFFSLIFYA